MTEEPFDQWGILELMGHIRVGGKVTEEQRFGATVGRIDIPTADGVVTQYFGGSALFRFTPTTELIAREIGAGYDSMPIRPWDFSVQLRQGMADAEDEN